MQEIANIAGEFDGKPLTTIVYKGRPCWIAKEVGAALGYTDGGRRFANKITGEWADEFIEDKDYAVLRGRELADFKDLAKDNTESVPTFAARLLLLFESGLHMALAKSNKPAGKKLRRFLVDEVLPQIARDGSYSPDREVIDGRIVETDVLAHRRRRALEFMTQFRDVMRLSSDHIERYAAHSIALIDGTAPPAEARLLDVSGYLEGKGMTPAEVRSKCAAFGKLVKAIYATEVGGEPPKTIRLVNGAERSVNAYTEEHRPLFDRAFDLLLQAIH